MNLAKMVENEAFKGLTHFMRSKEEIRLKYQACRDHFGASPRYRDFLKFAEINRRQLQRTYGRDAYSKLQIECGDEPNRFGASATPRGTIMKQFGDLALETFPSLPNSSDWAEHGLRPTVEG